MPYKEIEQDNPARKQSLDVEQARVCTLLDAAGTDMDSRAGVMKMLADNSVNFAPAVPGDKADRRIYEMGFPSANQIELVNTRGGIVGHDVVKETYAPDNSGKMQVVQSTCHDTPGK